MVKRFRDWLRVGALCMFWCQRGVECFVKSLPGFRDAMQVTVSILLMILLTGVSREERFIGGLYSLLPRQEAVSS